MLHIGWKKKTTPLGKLGSTWVHALDVEITNTHTHLVEDTGYHAN